MVAARKVLPVPGARYSKLIYLPPDTGEYPCNNIEHPVLSTFCPCNGRSCEKWPVYTVVQMEHCFAYCVIVLLSDVLANYIVDQ